MSSKGNAQGWTMPEYRKSSKRAPTGQCHQLHLYEGRLMDNAINAMIASIQALVMARQEHKVKPTQAPAWLNQK